MVRAISTATPSVASPISMNSTGVETLERLQHRDDDGAADHEGGVEHVDAGDDAGAAVGAGPGLHRGEGRHDVEAAGDREPGEIDHHPQAAGSIRTPRRRRPERALSGVP